MSNFVRVVGVSGNGLVFANVADVTFFRVVEAFSNPGHYAIYANGVEDTLAGPDYTNITDANTACEKLVSELGRVDLTE